MKTALPPTTSPNPWMYLTFLPDGRPLIAGADWFATDYYENIRRYLNSPLLWDPGARQWRTIDATRKAGSAQVASEAGRTILSNSFESEVVEFLDQVHMRWLRSVEQLPPESHISMAPLDSGDALVIVQETGEKYAGMIGIVHPQRGDPPSGKLLLERSALNVDFSLRDGLLLLGDADRFDPSSTIELIDLRSGQARELPQWPSAQVAPVAAELKDGTFVILGGLNKRCSPITYRDAKSHCAGEPSQPGMRYFPREQRWERLPALQVAFAMGSYWDSYFATQWSRNDVLVRQSGELQWIEGGVTLWNTDEANKNLPRQTWLMSWDPSHPDLPKRTIASLRKARTLATLLTLNDGRLVAIGGEAQLERVALEKTCVDCPDEFVSLGPDRFARTTEVLDESSATPVWRSGPAAHFGGGRAYKMRNGRIFKLSMADFFKEPSQEDGSPGYHAEIADAAFTAWKALPPLPMKLLHIYSVGAIGNRVLIATRKGPTVLWDDDAQRWAVLSQWPVHHDDGPVISFSPVPQEDRVLVRYPRSFDIVPLPSASDAR